MTSQPSLQTIVIHILPNISQSNDNQTMEFGQLIEHNKRNYSKIVKYETSKSAKSTTKVIYY